MSTPTLRAASVALAASCLLLLGGCPQPAPPEPPPWSALPDAASAGWLMNVWASGPSDVWAVGGSPGAGVVQHFDGTSWQARDLGRVTPLLDWTFGFAADQVWVVGQGGTLLRWDGAAFTPEDSGTTEDLWGLWGSAPDDLWAVGGSGVAPSLGVLLHRDASGWSSVPLPTLSRANVHALFKVWGSGASDVWAVGQHGLLLHYDGTAWEERPTGTGEDLVAVWGTGPEHVAIVGGRANGVLLLWDGVALRSVDLSYAPGLNGVWLRDPGVVHVAGVRGTLRSYAWDGTLLRDDDGATTLDFHSIHGVVAPSVTDESTLYAVGGSLFSTAAPYRGLAYTRVLDPGE